MFNLILATAATPLLVFFSYILLLKLSRLTGLTAPLRDNVRETCTLEPPVNAPDYSLMIVTRDIGEGLLKKLESISNFQSPDRITEVLIGLDGMLRSDVQDALRPGLNALEAHLPIKYIETAVHEGKNAVINRMLPLAKGSVLLFTDVDADLGSDTLIVLDRWFQDASVGAVAGLRVIVDESGFGAAQGSYVNFDTKIKNMEMRLLGSVTSCDGKLYAIRSHLTNLIPLHVTDDAYIGLGAPLHRKRLVFDPDLTATIGRPAKDPGHEFDRRRRVTTRGLHSLSERRQLFRIKHYGWYSYCLFANKICRRFAPVSLVLSILIFTFAFGVPAGLLALTTVLLLVLVSFRYLDKRSAPVTVANPAASPSGNKLTATLPAAVAYFILGMSAMTLGTMDFLRGIKVSKWEPRKSAQDYR